MSRGEISTDVARAASILREGGVVALPTETVYGLGADACNVAAVRRVFAIKGRPADHPLIVHLGAADWLQDWAREIPEMALALAEAFWPGPLTLVLPRSPRVSDAVTGGQDSVAVRVPAHPLALRLIESSGALVAPSANRFGRVSPTTAEHVREELGDKVDLILDGGPCAVGVESTIVSLLTGTPTLLRPGGIAPARLEAVLGVPLVARRDERVRVSGGLPAHYAPATPLELLPAAEVMQRAERLAGLGMRVAILGRGPGGAVPSGVERLEMPAEADAYARLLYASLRLLDSKGYATILVEAPPAIADWLAVRDRLMRAAAAFAGTGQGGA